jgi:ADP-ribosylglycohydrolase
LGAAVRIGDDTDTVAAIAGALLGARWGATSVPAEWHQILHGWPGYSSGDLETLATRIVEQGS